MGSLEVGFLETEVELVGQFEVTAKQVRVVDVISHVDPIEACADFIYREATWVLARERAS